MIKRYGLMLCTALVAGATLLVGLATAADKAAEKTPITPGLQTVQGDVLKIEGDSYVVKDMPARKCVCTWTRPRELEGSFKAGDKIEAQVTEKGHALSITKPTPIQFIHPRTGQTTFQHEPCDRRFVPNGDFQHGNSTVRVT